MSKESPLQFDIPGSIFVIRYSKIVFCQKVAKFYWLGNRTLRDFLFKKTEQEKQEVVANCHHLSCLKYSKYLPNVFTGHGARCHYSCHRS
jgi:hypothetical protein